MSFSQISWARLNCVEPACWPWRNRDAFEEKVGEEKFAEGVKVYTVPSAALSLFVADDQVDIVGAEPAFDFDDPRFLSQETSSSFAEYCRFVGGRPNLLAEGLRASRS